MGDGSRFAGSCTAHPHFASALLGIWIKGLQVEHEEIHLCTGVNREEWRLKGYGVLVKRVSPFTRD